MRKEIDRDAETVTTRIGFPMHVYETRRDVVDTLAYWRSVMPRMFAVQPLPFTPRPGPSRILWRGVAFNVLVYGSVALVVLAWRSKRLPGRRIALVVSGGLLVSLATVGVQLVPWMPRVPVLTDVRARSVGLPFRAVQVDLPGVAAVPWLEGGRWREHLWAPHASAVQWLGLERAVRFAHGPSVIGNWVFWSAVLGATFVPGAIVSRRRRRRRAKGQCLKCGYAMAAGGLDRCPECGAGA